MIKAPFNFVPLSDKVYLPEWANLISHDVPFEDGEDGTITVHITNHTPLFVRDGHAKDNETEWSSHIIDDQGNKRYFIPGTSLKGCFRSVMEILSFAKMSRFNNDSFGFRSFNKEENQEYIEKVRHVKDCGWLSREDDGYYIRECCKRIQKIHHSDIKKKFSSFNEGMNHETAECKQRSLSKDEPYPIFNCHGDIQYTERDNTYNVPEGKYRVVCTGYMKKKNVEYLFSEKQSDPIPVDDKVFRIFDTVHKNTPYYAGLNGKGGFLKNRLMSGESIPVFYEKDNKGNIVAIGITRMIKYPYKYSISDCVEHVSKDHNKKDVVDMPEAIFGYISDNCQLKGRVHIGNAFATSIVCDDRCIRVGGVLGQPRASYYPIYLYSEDGTPQNYSSISPKISGRKRYRIIEGSSTLEIGKGNGNGEVLTWLRPIPSGQTFICKIRVHNLKKCEIGALLSAITFNLTENTYHNIGQAKSFGYGKVSCKAELDGFNYSIEEYVNCFDEEISSFLQKRNSMLNNELSLSRLVQIASATHTKEEMTQMTLEEYGDGKKNFNILEEGKERELYIGIDENEAVKKIENQKLERKRKQKLYRLEIRKQQARQKLDGLIIQHVNEIAVYECMMTDPIKTVEFVNIDLESLTDSDTKIKKIDDTIDEFKNDLQRFEYLVATIIERYRQFKLDNLSFEEITTETENKINELEDKKSSVQSEFNSCIEQLKELKQKIKKGEGLSFLTDKNIRGEYNITTIANGSGRIEQFLKKNKDYVISDRDKNVVEEWLRILKELTMKNNDRRDFQNYDGKSWRKMIDIFGEKLAHQWYESLISK